MEEAKERTPIQSVVWDELFEQMEKAQKDGEDIGPLVAVRVPHPSGELFHPIVLSDPTNEYV
ncbi:hypothetical protein BT96DRAFT_919095 [Gymnopus androsaceus JB14]|uniref:Uncharacterized protein n=1 Tax=Gymnopus androsaceus JB14 TaxID=1447944 RepID=A0A6A4HWG1_9AGAR|nr:hypothetical protein BT96DRAFT_919095 [Gymnopus androsaceus JB14]